MGVKKVWDKLVGTVGGVNEDDEFETDEYEDEEEMEEERAPRRTPAVAPRRSGVNYAAPQEKPLRMVIVEPETFDDSQSIADYIRDRKPVVINFESTPDDIAKFRQRRYVCPGRQHPEGRQGNLPLRTEQCHRRPRQA